jgi:hypothetical protein
MIENVEKAAECENKLSNKKAFFVGEGDAVFQVFSKFVTHQLDYSLCKFHMCNLFHVHAQTFKQMLNTVLFLSK